MPDQLIEISIIVETVPHVSGDNGWTVCFSVCDARHVLTSGFGIVFASDARGS
jgi:hypothetical protein